MSNTERARLQMELEDIRVANARLERALAERDEAVFRLTRQVGDLQALGPQRPLATFAPVRLEIASLSRGTDLDGQPGDDGVTVYLRPVDADGDTVKAPGRIGVRILDVAAGEPRILGTCRVEEAGELRKTWYGKVGTSHYTVKCPFEAGVTVPESGKVVVAVEFLDYLSGATLTAMKEVRVTGPKNP